MLTPLKNTKWIEQFGLLHCRVPPYSHSKSFLLVDNAPGQRECTGARCVLDGAHVAAKSSTVAQKDHLGTTKKGSGSTHGLLKKSEVHRDPLGQNNLDPSPYIEIYVYIYIYIYVYIVLLTPAFVKSSILRFPNIPIGAIKPLRRNHVSVSLDRLRFPHVASSCHSRETPTSELAPRDFDPKGFSVRFHASTRRKVRFFLWFPGSRSRILEP